LLTAGKSTTTTSAPADSSARRAVSHKAMIEARVSILCPVGPPTPGFSDVPASGSALIYIAGTPKRLPASVAVPASAG